MLPTWTPRRPRRPRMRPRLRRPPFSSTRIWLPCWHARLASASVAARWSNAGKVTWYAKAASWATNWPRARLASRTSSTPPMWYWTRSSLWLPSRANSGIYFPLPNLISADLLPVSGLQDAQTSCSPTRSWNMKPSANSVQSAASITSKVAKRNCPSKTLARITNSVPTIPRRKHLKLFTNPPSMLWLVILGKKVWMRENMVFHLIFLSSESVVFWFCQLFVELLK